jgi:hypothetical protein
MKQPMHYYELAVMQGNNASRHDLDIKHLSIEGYATKEDYEHALRSFEEYTSEIKSSQRDEAAAFDEQFRYLPMQES